MEVYRVGDSTKCIVWNYHIMGFNGGRARQLVDMIASKGKRLEKSLPSRLISKEKHTAALSEARTTLPKSSGRP